MLLLVTGAERGGEASAPTFIRVKFPPRGFEVESNVNSCITSFRLSELIPPLRYSIAHGNLLHAKCVTSCIHYFENKADSNLKEIFSVCGNTMQLQF